MSHSPASVDRSSSLKNHSTIISSPTVPFHTPLSTSSPPSLSASSNPLPIPVVSFPSHDLSVLRKLNATLRENPLFLGNPHIEQHVQWVSVNNHRILVEIAEREDAKYKMAILECVGEISPLNFRLYPCAGWNGESEPSDAWFWSSPFKCAKARAHVRRPCQPLFKDVWSSCLENIDKLEKSVKGIDEKTDVSILQGDEIKIWHKIFDVRTSCCSFQLI
jgi:hypothetical protein